MSNGSDKRKSLLNQNASAAHRSNSVFQALVVVLLHATAAVVKPYLVSAELYRLLGEESKPSAVMNHEIDVGCQERIVRAHDSVAPDVDHLSIT